MNKEVAKRNLFDVTDALEALGVKTFLLCGTALGAYRDKDFCRLDSDTDIGFLYEDMAACHGAVQASLETLGFTVRVVGNNPGYPRAYSAYRDGEHIDIVGFSKNGCERYVFNSKRTYALVYSAYLLEHPVPIEFLGKMFCIPSPVDTYLWREYGDYMTESNDHVSRTRVKGYNPEQSLAQQQNGLAMLQNNISQEHLDNIHKPEWDYYAYLDSPQMVIDCWGRLFHRLHEFMGEPASVLDIGCGLGTAARALPRNWSYLGIDGSASAVQRATESYGCEDIHFRMQRVENFPTDLRRDILIFGNMFAVVVQSKYRVRFVERYLNACLPMLFAVVDLRRLDLTDLDKRYRRVDSFEFECKPLEGTTLPATKILRKAVIYHA